MKRITTTLVAIFALSLGLSVVLAQETMDMSDRTITEILGVNDDLALLELLVESVDLEDTLSGEGPFTLFAPMDSAFQNLQRVTISDLIDSPDKLRSILLNHVVEGELTADDILNRLLQDARQQLGEEGTAGTEIGEPVEALEEAEEQGEAALDEQQLGGAGVANLNITEPVRALLETGVTSPFEVASVHGDELRINTNRSSDTTFGEASGRQIGEEGTGVEIEDPVAALDAVEGLMLYVQNQRITTVDIIASNGVIHLISGLILPEGITLAE